jgi:hypothetical protein
MASLADLFNPTFLMFLGILVLVVALLVVYFESKMREQNHKIASMLSLVSTLAEDMNGVKMGLNHLAITGGSIPHINFTQENLGNNQSLIEVSDDEEEDEEEDVSMIHVNDDSSSAEENNSDNESESNSETDLEYTSDNDSTSETSSDLEETKLINLETYDSLNNECILNFEKIDNLDELDDSFINETNNTEDLNNVNETIETNENKHYLEDSIMSNNLKTISINLGDEQPQNEDTIDYKKLQLPKLRSIAIEKGVLGNSDASKLKKHDILKLLGVE